MPLQMQQAAGMSEQVFQGRIVKQTALCTGAVLDLQTSRFRALLANTENDNQKVSFRHLQECD